MSCLPIAGKFMCSKGITSRAGCSNGGAVRKVFLSRFGLPLNSLGNRSKCGKAESCRLTRSVVMMRRGSRVKGRVMVRQESCARNMKRSHLCGSLNSGESQSYRASRASKACVDEATPGRDDFVLPSIVGKFMQSRPVLRT